MSPHTRPLRFGVEMKEPFAGRTWAESARELEDLGYSTLFVPDHFHSGYGPITAMATALAATTSLHVAPLDSRITVQSCQQNLQFEQPFPGQPSVRVRCAQPQWQLFVTLNQGTEPAVVSRSGPAAPPLHKVLVPKELIKRGTHITAAMFVSADMPAAGMESQLIADPKLIANMELVRDLTPSTPLRTFDVKTAVLVKRGQEVQVSAGEGQGFLITMRAESLQDGGLGEQIRLKNSESGRSLTAVITGPNTARLK